MSKLDGKWIANSTVPNAALSNQAEATIKGRASGAGTGAVTDLTATQVRSILNVADGAIALSSVTKTHIESVLTGEISSHTHASDDGGSVAEAYSMTEVSYTGTDEADITKLNAAITSTSATSFTCCITSPAAWFESGFQAGDIIKIDSEYIKVITVNSPSGLNQQITSCTRGYLGTTAATHLINAAVGQIVQTITHTDENLITYTGIIPTRVAGRVELPGHLHNIVYKSSNVTYTAGNSYLVVSDTAQWTLMGY